MDNIRWQYAATHGSSPGHYTTFENNVRYFKYYLSQRTEHLYERWNIDYDLNLPSVNTTDYHLVSFIDQGGNISSLEVADGTTNLKLPVSTSSWFYQHNGEAYSPYIPIYEDCVLYSE